MTNCYLVSTCSKSDKFPEKQIYAGIRKASGGDETHSQIVIEGTMYESTYPGGVKITKNYIFDENDPTKRRQYAIRDLTEREIGAITAYFKWREGKINYAVIKLLVYIALSKTKPFWNKIGWTPMSIDAIWGEFCSAIIDNAVKFGGIELIKNQLEEFTTPHDLTLTGFFGGK